jgi:hypothetical protein
MPPHESQSDNDNEIVGEICRRGAPVIKTTIEIDKNLYLKMKEEVARSNSSIRDFLSQAAREKLTHEEKPVAVVTSSVNRIEKAIQDNPFMKKVLGVLEQEVRPPFNLALLLAKLEDLDIKPEEFSPSDLSDEFLKSLVKPVDALSGPVVAKDLMEALVQLRRG